MKVSFEANFIEKLNEQVRYISKDKPKAARKFKNELISNLRKDLKQPFNFKKSKYFEDENIRDYVFKGYTSGYEINTKQNCIVIMHL